LNHSSSPFCSGSFEDGVSWTICLGWLQTSILPILAIQGARITGTSHSYLTGTFVLIDEFTQMHHYHPQSTDIQVHCVLHFVRSWQMYNGIYIYIPWHRVYKSCIKFTKATASSRRKSLMYTVLIYSFYSFFPS
jgi:hypothetical protein